MNHAHYTHDHNREASGTPEELAMCPVANIPVNMKDAEAKGHSRTINGVTYYLCCNTCTEQFDADPSRFVS